MAKRSPPAEPLAAVRCGTDAEVETDTAQLGFEALKMKWLLLERRPWLLGRGSSSAHAADSSSSNVGVRRDEVADELGQAPAEGPGGVRSHVPGCQPRQTGVVVGPFVKELQNRNAFKWRLRCKKSNRSVVPAAV